MDSRNETLRSAEWFSPREEPVERARGALDGERIEELFERQAEMLLSIEHDVNPAVFEVLYSKIEAEHRTLLDIMALSAQSARREERLSRTLKAEYFTQRRLDSDLL